MLFQTDFEKDGVKVKIQGKEHVAYLTAELEIELTPSTGEVRASDNSCVEPPSGDVLDVAWAETTLDIYNDQGEEIGTLVYKGVEFFESLIDINEEDIEFDTEEII